MPITGSQKALMEARSGLARSGATRSDYYRQFPIVTIAGTTRTRNVSKRTLNIETQATQQASACKLTVWGFDPVPGQPIIVSSGAVSNRIFGGTVQTAIQRSVRAAAFKIYDLECSDWKWLLNRRRITKQYASGTGGSVVAADIINNYTSGFSTSKIKAGAPALSGTLSYRGTPVADAMTQLCDRIPGWKWYPDPDQIAHFYDTETGQSPVALTTANYAYDHLSFRLDITQLRTRFYGVGGGARTTAAVAAGATSAPVDECGWYSASGGQFISGSNIVTYTGISTASGAGSITGCSGILYDLMVGDDCNVFVQVDDAGAQATIAALEGGDGIHEGWVENNTWSLATTTQQANANLTAFKSQDVRGTYFSRDKQTKVNTPVVITLPARGISTTVTLQRVQRSLIGQDRWGFTADFAIVWSDLIDLVTGQVEAS